MLRTHAIDPAQQSLHARMSHYWIIKGNPGFYDWKNLRPGHVEPWRTRYPVAEMATGDRVFLWESGGRSRVIGFATVVQVPGFKAGRWRFRVKYLTTRLGCMPGIHDLRAIPELKKASFLKPGVFRTVYPLSAKQAAALYRVIVAWNPSDDIWREISQTNGLPDLDLNASAKEGKRRLVTHLRIERVPSLAPKKKAQFRKQHGGRLFCECCRHDYQEYGQNHEAMFEVHHLKALGGSAKEVETKLEDLAVVCSNCHRVIHRHNPLIGVDQLGKRLRKST